MSVCNPHLILTYVEFQFPWQFGKEIIISLYHLNRTSGTLSYGILTALNIAAMNYHIYRRNTLKHLQIVFMIPVRIADY